MTTPTGVRPGFPVAAPGPAGRQYRSSTPTDRNWPHRLLRSAIALTGLRRAWIEPNNSILGEEFCLSTDARLFQRICCAGMLSANFPSVQRQKEKMQMIARLFSLHDQQRSAALTQVHVGCPGRATERAAYRPSQPHLTKGEGWLAASATIRHDIRHFCEFTKTISTRSSSRSR